MLRDSLPEIVTGSVPGAKAKALLDRRGEAVPKVVTQSVSCTKRIQRGRSYSVLY